MIVSTSPIGIGNESAVAPEKFSHSFSMETPVHNFQKFSKEIERKYLSIFLLYFGKFGRFLYKFHKFKYNIDTLKIRITIDRSIEL